MLYDCLFHYSGNKTFTLPPPIRTFIADHLERDHKASPKEIYQHTKHFFDTAVMMTTSGYARSNQCVIID